MARASGPVQVQAAAAPAVSPEATGAEGENAARVSRLSALFGQDSSPALPRASVTPPRGPGAARGAAPKFQSPPGGPVATPSTASAIPTPPNDDGPPAGAGPGIEAEEWSLLPTKEKERIRILRSELDKLEKTNYFEWFDCTPDSQVATIKKSYFNAARRYHPDSLINESPVYGRLAEALFAKLSEAYDVITDDELETASASALSAAYDLIVFPGHQEYVTDAEFAAITGYRDRGGNLMFLSANNFFWRVERNGDTMRRTRQWRDIGKPEASLIGVQYRGNDDGARQAPFLVRDTSSAPWVWEGTGLAVGSALGADLGGYGTEIDGTSPASPPGTLVLAEVPDLFGPGKTAQMAYYETTAGAKVFAAGTLDFGGTVNHDPQNRLIQNLWARLSQP